MGQHSRARQRGEQENLDGRLARCQGIHEWQMPKQSNHHLLESQLGLGQVLQPLFADCPGQFQLEVLNSVTDSAIIIMHETPELLSFEVTSCLNLVLLDF